MTDEGLRFVEIQSKQSVILRAKGTKVPVYSQASIREEFANRRFVSFLDGLRPQILHYVQDDRDFAKH